MDLENIRRNYNKSKIDFHDLNDNPIIFFKKWLLESCNINDLDPNACVLSTVSANHNPTSRVVLLKEVSKDGFIFYTNYSSNKSIDIQNNNNVSLNFYWPELERQVRINGKAIKISAQDSDRYFKSRPRDSQLAACLSSQSAEINIDYDFKTSLDKLSKKFESNMIDRPDDWGGFCVFPNEIEFWQGRPSRFHDRLLFSLFESKWIRKRLSP